MMMERDFEKLLGEMKPSKEMLLLSADIFTDLWRAQREAAKQEVESIRRRNLSNCVHVSLKPAEALGLRQAGTQKSRPETRL